MNQMNRTGTSIRICAIVFALFGLMACSDDPFSNTPVIESVNLLVANEGNFAEGNGSITSYDPETRQRIAGKFEQVNGRPLAGIIQSVTIQDERIYIVLNASDKLEIADASTLESIATIVFEGEDALTPSAFALAGEKGYVSGLYSNSVALLDLQTHTVTDTRIDVGSNPSDLLVSGNRLFVANSGFGYDNTVTVIDTGTDQVSSTLEAGAGPIRLSLDDQGSVWVVSNGRRAFDEEWNRDPENDINGRIDILNSTGTQVAVTIETGGFPKSVAVHREIGFAWVVNAGYVQQIDLSTYEVAGELFLERDFSGIGLSPHGDRLYLADSKGYEQAGQAIIYNLEGAAVDSFQVGIAPSDFLFRVEVE